jgi:hypothetical protein
MDLSLRINLPPNVAVHAPEENDGGYLGLVPRLSWQLAGMANVYIQYDPRPPESGGGPGGLQEILVNLSGDITNALFAFREIFRVARKYLIAYEGRELTFELGDRKLTLRGHSQIEEVELLQQLFPEALESPKIEDSETRDDESLHQQTLQYLQYLKQIYSIFENESLSAAQIGQEFGWNDQTRDLVTNHLRDAGLIEVTSADTIRITTAGQRAVDQSIRHPDRMETYLRSGGVNINVQGDFNISGDVVGRDKTSVNTRRS